MKIPAAHGQMILNGELIASAAARISPLGDGFMYGHGLFETIKVLGGVPAFFSEHFQRLQLGAAELGLAFTASEKELRARSLQCLAANQVGEGGLKIVIFQDEARVNEMILTQPPKYPPDFYSRGFRLKTIPEARRETSLPGLKTLNYLKFIVAKRAAQAAGFDEALLVEDGGIVLEGATSNLFIVKDGTVSTPAQAQGILPGIVRAQVLRHLAGTARADAREEIISISRLREADEVFITNSLLGVMPVAGVDGQNYGVSQNPVTRSLMEEYRSLELRSLTGESDSGT